MKVRALISFCGRVNMAMGDVDDIDAALAEDLARAGYIEILDKKNIEILDKKNVETIDRKEKENGKKSKVSAPRNGKKHGKR